MDFWGFPYADENGKAAIVGSVASNSPAKRAGFLKDDKIVKVGEKAVYSVNQARVAISQSLPGSEVSIEVIRGERHTNLPRVLGSMSEEMAPSWN